MTAAVEQQVYETTADKVGCLSAVDGVRAALARLLAGGLVGQVRGKGRQRLVPLKACFENFPLADEPFDAPCASLTEVSSELEDFADVLDDVTFEDDAGRLLAIERTEASGELAIDLWANDPEERKALKAAFPAVFGLTDPGLGIVDSNSARGITLELPDEMLPMVFRGRADFRPVARITIEELPNDVDDSLSSMRSEWRATARVSWEAYVITAADVERMDVLSQSGEVTEPGALTEAEEAEGEGR